MISPEIKKLLISDLKQLSFDLQKKVQEFAHALLISHKGGVSGKELLKFSGIINNKDADRIKNTIKEGCEKVDHNGW